MAILKGVEPPSQRPLPAHSKLLMMLLDKREVLTVVFGYLDTIELLNASCVCTLWASASQVQWEKLFGIYDDDDDDDEDIEQKNDETNTNGTSGSIIAAGVRTTRILTKRKHRFLKRWRKEQKQFWLAHQRANGEIESNFSRHRQLQIASNASAMSSSIRFLVRFSFPRFDGLSWNGIVPLKEKQIIVLHEGEGEDGRRGGGEEEEPTIIGYKLDFDMANVSFSTGKSNWDRLFAVFYPFNKRSHDVLEEIRNDPNCPFAARAFQPDAFYITIVAFDDADDEEDITNYHTLVPCQNCVMQWETSKELRCLPITYGNYISYLGNLRFRFLGRPGVVATTTDGNNKEDNNSITTFQLETMSLCVYGRSLSEDDTTTNEVAEDV